MECTVDDGTQLFLGAQKRCWIVTLCKKVQCGSKLQGKIFSTLLNPLIDIFVCLFLINPSNRHIWLSLKHPITVRWYPFPSGCELLD